MDLWLTYLALGAAAGLVAGLLGVGGGLIIVPVLATQFHAQGFGADKLMHLAVGTSLATIVLTSISSVRAHHRHGAVDWSIFHQLTPGILLGALAGAALADLLASDSLRRIFGVFELAVAAQLAFGRPPAAHRTLPGRLALGSAGTVIGSVSAIVGIGGGTLTVPFLAWCNVPLRRAVATSAACGLPIAVAGATGYVLMGWGEEDLPAGATGYVYWPAFAGIVLASVLAAPLGARLAHRLPVDVLRRVFAVFLVALGIKMLWPT